MEVSKTHIINKVFIEVTTTSKERAYYFKDTIDMFIKEYVLPRLLISFDNLENKNPDHFIQLERLDVELEIKPKQNLKGLEEDIAHKITKQIHKLREEKSYKTNEEDTIKLLKSEERRFEKFLYFLENGTYSWFNTSEELQSFNKNLNLFNDEQLINKVLPILKKPLSRKRFISQFANKEIQEVFNCFIAMNPDKIKTSWNNIVIQDVISKGNANDKKYTEKARFLIWDIAFGALIEEIDPSVFSYKFTQLFFETTKQNLDANVKYVKTYFLHLLKELSVLAIIQNLSQEIKKVSNALDSYQNGVNQPLSQQNDKEISKTKIDKEDEYRSLVSNKMQEEKSDKLSTNGFNSIKEEKIYSDVNQDLIIPEDVEDLYVNQAGLILVHPFLSQLLKNCGVINDHNEFLDKEKAVHILHYIATGKEQQFENNMVLEKFLCNLPSKYPINRFIQLEDEVKNHADEMLTAVIGHWEVMKNSSNDLLRNEFLQRPGKLIHTEGRPRIILERKTQDILIDKIPWNISMVKLPWKDKIIFVDW